MATSQSISLDEIVAHFQGLDDPRSSINRRHPLVSVIVIAVLAVLAGASGPTAIALAGPRSSKTSWSPRCA
jgi:hypothetical protein